MSLKENKVFKKNGELVVQFTFKRDSTMLEMEHEIESLIDSVGESVSEAEKQGIQAQLLDAIENELHER